MKFLNIQPGMKFAIPALGGMGAREVEAVAVNPTGVTLKNVATGRRSSVSNQTWDHQQRYYKFTKLIDNPESVSLKLIGESPDYEKLCRIEELLEHVYDLAKLNAARQIHPEPVIGKIIRKTNGAVLLATVD